MPAGDGDPVAARGGPGRGRGDGAGGLTRQLNMTALETTWQQITGQPLPQTFRDYITSPPTGDDDHGDTP